MVADPADGWVWPDLAPASNVAELPSFAQIGSMDGAELDHALVAFERARRQIEAGYLAVLDRADTVNRNAADGHASVRGWTAALTKTAPAEIHRRMQTMRAVRDLPSVATALAEGSVGVDQVRELAKAHANPRARSVIVDGADQLVEHATGKEFADFSAIVARWEAFADPDGADKSAAAIHDRRNANVFERDGVVHLHARCGTAQGAALLEIFARQCDAEFRSDWDDALARHGDRTHPGLLDRTPDQRRMDALHALFLAAVSAPPGSKAPEPVVNIVMTVDEYEARLAALHTGQSPAPASADDIDTKRCETIDGIPIPPTDAVAASITGRFRRVVVDSAGVVTDLGRKRRFTGAARDAVLLSNGRRCLWPGCGRTHQNTEIDHTHEHARGGRTCTGNGGPACGRHNRRKSRGYLAHRAPDGTWHVYRPDGTELTEPAAL